jgi:hypothetical protein
MLFLLIVSIFFYSSDHAPEARLKIEPSAEACMADLDVVKAQLEAKPDVRVVKPGCFAVSPDGDKS